ncbi:hypothetical protein HELRODRAFT_195105, partial [Helobdella robusta]|uniref:Uncharacterized protein n=1 Tax=Helobdella robusta TaxID=6412 RepID=T1FWR4_HELRO
MSTSVHTSVNCKACNSDDSFKDGSNIFAAVKSGILMAVQSIVEVQGPGAFNTFDEKGNTPAHWACLHGNKLLLNYIIECDGFINEPSQNDIGQRPIHWACYEGHLHIVEILLQQGVSIDIQDKKGKTPLIAAAQNGRCSVGAFLISKGASKVFVDCDGDGPLHWAAYNGQVPMVRMLVYFGYDPEQPDSHQQTPVHLACLRGSVDVVRDLCEIDKVDITVRDKNGCTPYMLAVKKKQYNACNLLKQVEQRRLKKIYFPRNFKSLVDGSFVGGSGLNMYKFLVLFLLFFAYPLYVYE